MRIRMTALREPAFLRIRLGSTKRVKPVIPTTPRCLAPSQQSVPADMRAGCRFRDYLQAYRNAGISSLTGRVSEPRREFPGQFFGQAISAAKLRDLVGVAGYELATPLSRIESISPYVYVARAAPRSFSNLPTPPSARQSNRILVVDCFRGASAAINGKK